MAEQLNTDCVPIATRGGLSLLYTEGNAYLLLRCLIININMEKFNRVLETKDGSYQYPQKEHKRDTYFTCKNGTAQRIKCPGTQLFAVKTGTCQESANCI